MRAMLEEMKSIGAKLENFKVEVRGEMSSLNLKIDGMITGWSEDKRNILAKQSELEARLDRMERGEKRNNIVITGLDGDGAATASSIVNGLLSQQLGLTVTAVDAFQVKLKSGERKYIARMRNWDDKMAVMRAKGTLKNNVYISDDLTKKDQFIQFKARQLAKELKVEGRLVKVGTGRIVVDGATLMWDEKQQSFITRKN